MKRLVVVLLLSVGVALPHMMAQNSVNMNGQTTNITNCNLDIYDNGGPNGNYGSLRNDILTVYPESGQGRISLEVLNLDIITTRYSSMMAQRHPERCWQP